MANAEKIQAEGEPSGRDSRVPMMYFEPPWTEADEIWAEWMTGEYEERMAREASEQEAREADL